MVQTPAISDISREIIDESDVFIDVHKAIRRLQPAPRLRLSRSTAFTEDANGSRSEKASNGRAEGFGHDKNQRIIDSKPQQRKKSNSIDAASSPKATFLLRRTSGASNPIGRDFTRHSDSPEIREHLKHLGPSNLASRPRETRYNNVKIKRRPSGIVESPLKDIENVSSRPVVSPRVSASGGIGEGLLRSAGKDASDGVYAVQVGYGATDGNESAKSQDLNQSPSVGKSKLQRQVSEASARTIGSTRTTDTINSLPHIDHAATLPLTTRAARSGSITENFIETGGIRKVVLETNSSSGDEGVAIEEPSSSPEDSKAGKKKKRKKRKKASSSETEPLLDPEERH